MNSEQYGVRKVGAFVLEFLILKVGNDNKKPEHPQHEQIQKGVQASTSC